MGSELSITCFRFAPPGVTDRDRLNQLNRSILESINAAGCAHLSPTTLDGWYCLRVCIVNFRTKKSDIDLLVNLVTEQADRAINA